MQVYHTPDTQCQPYAHVFGLCQTPWTSFTALIPLLQVKHLYPWNTNALQNDTLASQLIWESWSKLSQRWWPRRKDGKGTSGIHGNFSLMSLRDHHLWLSSSVHKPASRFVAWKNQIRQEKKISGEQFGPVLSKDVPRRLLTRTSNFPRPVEAQFLD